MCDQYIQCHCVALVALKTGWLDIAVQKGAENGKDFSGDYWFTRVYVNQGGRWITVALQSTLIQK
jgi:hypothetical protein